MVHSHIPNFSSAQQFYKTTSKRSFTTHQENTIFEQLFFGLHQLAALYAFLSSARKADVARVGIVTWYYGVYYAASGMITAQDGSFQDDHAGTANSWNRQFAARSLAMTPFGLRVPSLMEAAVKSAILAVRGSNNFDLKTRAWTDADALGACCSYLSGTASWYRWKTTEDLKTTRDFKQLGVPNFRTKAARELRDTRLSSRSISFLHQAFRYRGKANYREALFLGYGPTVEAMLADYVADLHTVLSGFLIMAGAFVSNRLGKTLWDEFVADVEVKRAFSVSPLSVWK